MKNSSKKEAGPVVISPLEDKPTPKAAGSCGLPEPPAELFDNRGLRGRLDLRRQFIGKGFLGVTAPPGGAALEYILSLDHIIKGTDKPVTVEQVRGE